MIQAHICLADILSLWFYNKILKRVRNSLNDDGDDNGDNNSLIIDYNNNNNNNKLEE